MARYGAIKLATDEAVSLLWISQGKSLSDVAAIEGKRTEDIQHCVYTALGSLNVTSIPAAIAKARFLGLI